MAPIEERVRAVLAVLVGEVTVAEAARRHGVTATTVAKWRDRFVDAGKAGLENATPGPRAGSVDERRLRAENEQLKLALAEQMVQLRIWQKGAEQSPMSLRRPRSPESGTPDAGFEVRSPGRHSAERAVAAPKVDDIEPAAAKYAADWPAWGHRKIAAMMRADGYDVSTPTVLRALRRRGLLLPQGFRADRKSWAALRRKVFRDPPTERNRVWQTDFSEFERAREGPGGSARWSTTPPRTQVGPARGRTGGSGGTEPGHVPGLWLVVKDAGCTPANHAG